MWKHQTGIWDFSKRLSKLFFNLKSDNHLDMLPRLKLLKWLLLIKILIKIFIIKKFFDFNFFFAKQVGLNKFTIFIEFLVDIQRFFILRQNNRSRWFVVDPNTF